MYSSLVLVKNKLVMVYINVKRESFVKTIIIINVIYLNNAIGYILVSTVLFCNFICLKKYIYVRTYNY